MQRLGRIGLALAGALVIVAGVIHLAMTAELDRWLHVVSNGSLPPTAYSATLLNHVVVGVLLLPLGVSLATLGGAASRGERAARLVLAAGVLAVASLPVIVYLTATTQMLAAPAFLIALCSLAAAAVLSAASLLATCARASRGSAADDRVETAVQRAQRLVAEHVPPGERLVDELIAERHASAAAE